MMRFGISASLRLVTACGLVLGGCLLVPRAAGAQTTLPTPTNFGTSPAPLNGKHNDTCGFTAPYGYIGADDVTFSAVVSAPSGQLVFAEFRIVPNDGSAPLDFSVANIGGGKVLDTVPRTDFTNGVTYTWQVRETDSSGAASPYTRACHFISDQTFPPAPTVSSATFNSTTTPPAGTLGTFTFSVSGPDAGAVVGFIYQFGPAASGHGFVAVGRDGIATTPPLRSIDPGPDTITVNSVDHGGNFSQPTTYEFVLAMPPSAADKDMTGDGFPDLLTVGGTAGLPSGLWLATGKPKNFVAAQTGQLKGPATNIGINGVGFDIPGSPSEFDGAEVITGQFFGQGFQDVLVYYPSGNFAGKGAELKGTGDGSAIPGGQESAGIFQGALADANGDNPLQIVNANASIYGTGYPDLLAPAETRPMATTSTTTRTPAAASSSTRLRYTRRRRTVQLTGISGRLPR
jgi:hypothetical protein